MGRRVSPDGELIVAVGDDGMVRRWNARTGSRASATDAGGELPLYSVAFSRDGRRFAAGGEDGVIRVWIVPGGPPVAVLRGQGSRVYDVGFGRDGDRVVSAGDDGTVRLWDAGRTTQVWKVPGADLARSTSTATGSTHREQQLRRHRARLGRRHRRALVDSLPVRRGA